MLCDKCGREEATVHLMDIRRGIPAETHLCEKCAEMFLPLESADLADFLEQLPPRQSAPSDFYSSPEPEPLPGEADMTCIGQHVLVAHPASGIFTPVTPPTGRSFSPVWSPTSQLLAHVYLDHTRYAVRVTDPAASQLQRFYDVGWGELPQWTPDGSHLCFSRVSGDVRSPVLADVHTGQHSPLLYRPDRDQYHPVLSPDGKSLAFLSGPPTVTPEAAAEISLMIADLSGGQPRLLLADREHDFGLISWSPDVKCLAVLTSERLANDALENLDLPPAGRQDLVVLSIPDAAVLFRLHAVITCSWSPDSSHLLVVRDHESTLSLECIDTTSWSEPRPVAREIHLPGGTLGPSTWAQDGKSFVFIAGKEEHRQAWIASPTVPPLALSTTDVKAAAWNPVRPELALLRKSGDVHEVLLVNPDDPSHPRSILGIKPEDYYDVIDLAWSFDGQYLALEAHSADFSDFAD